MDAPEHPSPIRDASLRPLGVVVMAIGVLGLVRLVPEFVSFRKHLSSTYCFILMADVALSGLSLGAGLGMHRGWKYGATLTCLAAGGAALVNALVLLGWLGLRNLDTIRGGYWHGILVIAPRMVYYVLTLGFWPYGIRIAFKSLPQAGRLRWAFLVGGALASGLAVTGIVGSTD